MYYNGWHCMFKKETKQMAHFIATKKASGSSSFAKILESSDVINFL